MGLCPPSKFPDNTNWQTDRHTSAAIRKDLDRLENGADKNLIKSKKGKCQVLHLVRNKPRHHHNLEADQLESSSAKKDIGVLVNLTVSQQCTLVAEIANSLLGCVRKNTASSSREVILPLYSTLVRMHSESRFQYWEQTGLPSTRNIGTY